MVDLCGENFVCKSRNELKKLIDDLFKVDMLIIKVRVRVVQVNLQLGKSTKKLVEKNEQTTCTNSEDDLEKSPAVLLKTNLTG